jgi:DNA-binding MarR family transcriptional regulator
VMRMIRAEMRNQRAADLAVPQYRALQYIERNPGVSLQSLAHHLGLTAPTVSKMVDGLVFARLVSRAASAHDRRKITLTLTSPGKEILEQAHQATQDRLAHVLSHLSPEECETVLRAMKLLHTLFLPTASHLESQAA